MELQLEQKFVLNAVARQGLRDLLFDFSWDHDRNPENRLVLKAKMIPNEIAASYKFIENEGKFHATYLDRKIRIEAAYCDETAIFEGEYKHDPNREVYFCNCSSFSYIQTSK